VSKPRPSGRVGFATACHNDTPGISFTGFKKWQKKRLQKPTLRAQCQGIHCTSSQSACSRSWSHCGCCKCLGGGGGGGGAVGVVNRLYRPGNLKIHCTRRYIMYVRTLLMLLINDESDLLPSSANPLPDIKNLSRTLQIQIRSSATK
jgi:hypothetical protein